MHLPHDHGSHTALLAGMPKEDTLSAVAELMKTMSDSKRLQIYWLLCHCEECVVNLAAITGLSSPAVSHHLKLLKEAGLIVSRREGKEVYYTAADTPRTHILHDMTERIIDMACPVEEQFEECHSYDSQVQAINEIHCFLTADLSARPTIEELSLRFHMNPTTLKAEFKRVFGQPVAAYMKEYRMKQAAQLLRQTDLPISEIATAVGYQNQSKFTRAFRDVMGILPKNCRKNKNSG